MDGVQGTFALLDAIAAQAPVGVGFWDAQLRLRYANEALARLIGLPEEACLGRTLPVLAGEIGVALERLLAQVLATEDPVVGRAVHGRTPASGDEAIDWTGAYFPLRGEDGTTIGVAAVMRRLMEERPTAELQRALQEALAARTEAELARSRTAFIAEAGARMATSMDARQALRRLARAAVPRAADWCSVSLIDRDGRLSPVAAAHRDEEQEALLWAMLNRRPLHVDGPAGPAEALRAGRPVLQEVVEDADLERIAVDEHHLRHMRALGIRSSLIVPLSSPRRAIGTITLVHAESGRRYGPEDVTMAEALAAWAGLHVENARLYTERSLIASTLQEGLLPAALPELPGVDLAVRYRPAGDQNQVGGDFYDVYPVEEGRFTAVVGDVSGKGAAAAALTALARHTLFAGAVRGGTGPENLALLNDALLRRGGGGHFCTAVVLDAEPRDGELVVRIANGGHPAPLVLRAGGAVAETDRGGMLIGAVEAPPLHVEEVRLRPGDLLVAYTDGAIELRGDDPAAGERLLRERLGALAGEPAATVAAELEAAVVAASGGEPQDDVALLVVGPAPR